MVDALFALRDCPKPTVARIHGPCTGAGLEIAVMCDLRIAARSARFGVPIQRSEEHTSELQSLMRISYAVFCLKKTKTTTKKHNSNHNAPTSTLSAHSYET